MRLFYATPNYACGDPGSQLFNQEIPQKIAMSEA